MIVYILPNAERRTLWLMVIQTESIVAVRQTAANQMTALEKMLSIVMVGITHNATNPAARRKVARETSLAIIIDSSKFLLILINLNLLIRSTDYGRLLFMPILWQEALSRYFRWMVQYLQL